MHSQFIRSLPKAELHLHLEGTIEPDTLVKLSRRHDPRPLTPAEARALYEYEDFHGFLMAFKAITARLLTPEDFELATYELTRRLCLENVRHAEVYVSVGVVHYRGHEFEPLFEGMELGRLRGEQDFDVSLFWIFDAVRHFGIEPAARVFRLAAANIHRNVVGVGIGGDERRGPAEWFRPIYQEAAAHGLRLTAHAGENAGPESIWGALNLGAERIGHGLNAWQDPELMQVLAERQVPVEICITSNVKTGCCATVEEHPVRRYFDSGLMLTLGSDDPAMFQTSLVHEYEIAQATFGFTPDHLRELARNSFEASFLPAERKLEFLNLIDQQV